MINVKNVKRFCKDDISKIENYDTAIAETLKNKTKSEDTKRKMSEAKKAYWARRSNGV